MRIMLCVIAMMLIAAMLLGRAGEVLTGDVIAGLDDTALTARVSTVQVFAEVEPQQKERIIRAFQAAGHAVG